MTEHDKLHGGADALEDMARWCQQPDYPSAVYGFCSAEELMLRAAAMRARADVLGEGR